MRNFVKSRFHQAMKKKTIKPAKKLRNPKIVEAGKKTQWKKGVSPNPAGRPPMLPNLNLILAKVLGEVTYGKTATEHIIAKLRSMADKGDKRAAELLLDRGYGRVIQAMEIHTDQEIAAPTINVYTGTAPPLSSSEDKVDTLKQKKDDN